MALQNTNLPVETEFNDAEKRTLTYFNGYFDVELKVDSNAHDTVYSFFLREMGDASSATAFTHSLITISYENKLNPLDLLNEFNKQEGISVTALMAALINRTRRDTSLLGSKTPTTTNPGVARNILP